MALGSSRQDRSLYMRKDTSAPTVSLLALMVVVMVVLRLSMGTMLFDVSGAYLYAKVKKNKIVKFRPNLAKILVNVVPGFS